MWKKFHSLIGPGLISNVVSLYGVQVAKYLLPLITVPYLTRVLGASGWGLLALVQGYGAYLAMPIDYGFNFSATREVARLREDREGLSNIFAEVLGAKCLMASGCVLVSFGVVRCVSVFRDHQLIFWTAVVGLVVPCGMPVWYFLGLERLKLLSALDFFVRLLGTAGIFLVVRGRNDVWKVLAVQGAASSLATFVAMYLVYREIAFRLPTWRGIWRMLREGRSMFVSRAAIGLFTSGNAFILGLFAAPGVVGYYAGAEKLVRAPLQLFQPPYQALFPRVSAMLSRAPDRAASLTRAAAVLLGGSGLIGACFIFLFAPWLVRILLGTGFGRSIPVLRLLVLLLPLIGLNMATGGLWMIPHAMDRAFEWITLGAGAINIGLATALAGRYQGMGVALAVVIAEIFVAAAMGAYLVYTKHSFWRMSIRAATRG
jgi:polysaccharide transporter, PST family